MEGLRYSTVLSSRGWRAAVVALAGAVLLTQLLAHRPDPAAEPGLQVATVLLLEADLALARPPNGAGPTADAEPVRYPDPGDRAERAATVRTIWAESARAARLDALQGLPLESRQVRLVVTDWAAVRAWAHRGEVDLVGRVERREAGQAWQAEGSRRWRLELTRGDPVGVLRGWRLLSARTEPVSG